MWLLSFKKPALTSVGTGMPSLPRPAPSPHATWQSSGQTHYEGLYVEPKAYPWKAPRPPRPDSPKIYEVRRH